MSILWIIYFVIGIFLGFGCIYMAFNDKKLIKEYEELNGLLKNSGTIAMYIITIVLAIAVIFLWPILLLYLFIKKNTKGGYK